MRRMSAVLLSLGLLSLAWAAPARSAPFGPPGGEPLLRARQEAQGATLVFAADDSDSDDDDSDDSGSDDSSQ